MSHSIQAPRAAVRLGAAGLVPFAAGSAAIWLVPAERLEWTGFALAAYGAVILSFMGAVHWGFMISPGAKRGRGHETRWLSLGVMPALVAWVALLTSPLNALVLLAAGFVGVYALDRMAIAAVLAPSWYGPFRLRLTAAVIFLLLLGTAGLGLRMG